MNSHSPEGLVRLGDAAVVLRHGASSARFRVNIASLNILAGRRPVHLRLEGPQGSVIVELSRIAFWRLTAEFHERSISATDADTRRLTPPGSRS